MRAIQTLMLVAALCCNSCVRRGIPEGKVSPEGLAAIEAAAPAETTALGIQVVRGTPPILLIYPSTGAVRGSSQAQIQADDEPLTRRFGPVATSTLLAARGRAEVSAPISPEPKPLIIFAPGAGMPGAAYRLLAERLAAEGVVVAILNPQRSAPGSEEAFRAIEIDFARAWSHLHQREDIGIDWTRAFLGGHSLGGAGAVDMLHLLPARGAFNLDGDFLFRSRRPAPDRPILYLVSEDPRDGNAIQQRRSDDWALVSGGRPNAIKVLVPDSLHDDFVDVSILPRHLIVEGGRHQLGPAAPGVVQTKTVEEITSFLRRASIQSAVKGH